MSWDRIREWEKKWHEVLVVILVILGLAAILVMTDTVSEIGISKESSLTILLISIGLISIGLIESKHRCELIIILIIVFAAILCYEITKGNLTIDHHYLLIAVVGIAALIIPLILSISSKYNIGSKLDSGEIRKSIVISLTIIYIIFLVMSFDQTLKDQPVTGGKYILNATYEEKAYNISQKFISMDVNSTSDGVLQVIPVTATANVSNGTVQITPHLCDKIGVEGGGAGTIPLAGENSTAIPTDVINSFTKNFLWVYALIISFYFGSRILEERADNKNVSKYIVKLTESESDPLNIAKKRYSLGDIGSREFITMKKDLEEQPEIRIENVEFDKTNTTKDGDKNKITAVLSIWNGWNKDIKVDRVYIDGKICEIKKPDKGIKPKTHGEVNAYWRTKRDIGLIEKIDSVKISTSDGMESEKRDVLIRKDDIK